MTTNFLKASAGFLIAAILIIILALITHARAADSKCPTEPSAALARARDALKANEPKKDRLALECLVQAVAALDAKLEGLRDGSVPFTGPVDAGVIRFRVEGKQP